MKIKIYLSLTLLIIVFLGTKCRKDNTPPPTYYLPQEVKDYMYFQPGTYWVYKDSASGVLDSIIVTEANSEMFTDMFDPPANKISHIEERFTIKTYSFLDDYEYDYIAFARGNNCSTDYCAYVRREKIIPNNTDVPYTYALFYPFTIGYTPTAASPSVQSLSAKYDSLLVEGKYYKDVIEYYETKNSTETNQPTYFYIAKNYGVIRKKIWVYNGSLGFWEWRTWELLRSNIIK
jgi:hypothetical protein